MGSVVLSCPKQDQFAANSSNELSPGRHPSRSFAPGTWAPVEVNLDRTASPLLPPECSFETVKQAIMECISAPIV